MFRVEERDARITITLERPPVNAIDDVWLAKFHAVADDLKTRDDVAVVHIRSALSVFGAGMDLAHLAELAERPDGTDTMVREVSEFQRAFDRIQALPQVVVAEIGGAALGGGLELALACDLRVASTTAKFGLPEAALGLIPGAGGTQRLSWLCGRGVASRLILAGERISGSEAEQLGIVQWAFEPDELAERAEAIVGRIASLSLTALREAKQLLAAAGDRDRDGFYEEREADRRLFASDDTRARIRGFMAGTR
jgi:enoyl-CoA hydratase